MSQKVQERIVQLTQELADLFAQTIELGNKMSALTQVARSSGWDQPRLKEARAPWQQLVDKAAEQILLRQAELQQLSPATAPPLEQLPDDYQESPTFVQFDRSAFSVKERIHPLQQRLLERDVVLESYSVLRPSDQVAYDGGLTPLALPTLCKDVGEIPDAVFQQAGVALTYFSRDARANFTVYLFDLTQDSFCASLDASFRLVHFRGAREAGAWFEMLVATVVQALGVQLASYGEIPPRAMLHIGLDAKKTLAVAVDPATWQSGTPRYFVIADDLIDGTSLTRELARSGLEVPSRLMGHSHLVGGVQKPRQARHPK